MQFTTDASGESSAAVLGDVWFSHDWTKEELADLVPDISHREFWIIVAACITFASELEGQTILFLCDNMAVVHVINSGACRDRVLMKLLRELHFVSARHSFQIVARHLPGVENLVADALSRPVKRHLAWEFQPSLSQQPCAYSTPSLRL